MCEECRRVAHGYWRVNSTRRLRARPSSVAFDALGAASPKPRAIQLGPDDAPVLEIGNDRLGAAQAERPVVLGIAGRVGVAVDEHTKVGMSADEIGDLVENDGARRKDHGAPVGEEHVAVDRQLFEIVGQRIALEVGNRNREPSGAGEVQESRNRPNGDDDNERGNEYPARGLGAPCLPGRHSPSKKKERPRQAGHGVASGR